MNHHELFILHPIAYGHAQEILRLESDMVRNGHGPDQRIAFLQTESERLLAQADVVITESLSALLPSSRADLIIDLDGVQALLQRHGHGGTLRQTRNLQRRYGLDLPVIDSLIVVGALGILASDPDVESKLTTLFGRRMAAVMDHPSMEEAERAFQATTETPELPSVRERRMIETARALIANRMDELDILWDFDDAEVRMIAHLYGRILDLPLVDILMVLVQNGMADTVQSTLRESLASSAILYRHVLTLLISARIQRFSGGGDQTPPSSAPITPPQPAPIPADNGHLLTVREAMALLRVSRQTLHRMVKDGKVVPVRIGRAVRYSRNDLECFIGR
jgi:excisionase family DNA binding protein